MLIIKAKSNEYVKNGNPVFVYTVASNLTDAAKATKEVEEYNAACGTNLRKNDAGDSLYFTSRPAAAGSELKKTSSGRFQVYQDNLEDSAASKIAAIEAAEAQFLGKLKAVGLTPAQAKAALLASF